ncbi:tol-pal system YbgF family protein [Phycisphaerales bacterium AB-hyl4]|uniref:Tol-pal system YbgF family protein n=1 Tax=Natronomicrosphaera hydrolytica TaxID=3242702 RepID=A0ABV4U168_9BACT
MTRCTIRTTNRNGATIIHVICGVLAIAWLLSPAAITHADEAPAILLPAGMEDDVITQHLRAGEFDEAREVAESQFGRAEGQLALRLYQHGMAHLGLARETDDADHYKTAGISFMRALTYFPRSRFAGYAELELGYIHARIGRDDIARRLLTRVRPAIDPEQDPDYHERLMTLLDELP